MGSDSLRPLISLCNCRVESKRGRIATPYPGRKTAQVLQKASELGLKLERKDFVQVFSESLGETSGGKIHNRGGFAGFAGE